MFVDWHVLYSWIAIHCSLAIAKVVSETPRVTRKRFQTRSPTATAKPPRSLPPYRPHGTTRGTLSLLDCGFGLKSEQDLVSMIRCGPVPLPKCVNLHPNVACHIFASECFGVTVRGGKSERVKRKKTYCFPLDPPESRAPATLTPSIPNCAVASLVLGLLLPPKNADSKMRNRKLLGPNEENSSCDFCRPMIRFPLRRLFFTWS